MVTDEHHETAYWLAGLTSTTQLFLCGPCYCAVTNTADGSINRSIVLSPLERVQLSAVEYLLRLAITDLPDLTATARILEKLQGALDAVETRDNQLGDELLPAINAAKRAARRELAEA